MDPALIQLQELAAHQGEEIARLSEELYAQQKEIRALQKRLAQVEAQAKAGDSGIRLASEETPPPHY